MFIEVAVELRQHVLIARQPWACRIHRVYVNCRTPDVEDGAGAGRGRPWQYCEQGDRLVDTPSPDPVFLAALCECSKVPTHSEDQRQHDHNRRYHKPFGQTVIFVGLGHAVCQSGYE